MEANRAWVQKLLSSPPWAWLPRRLLLLGKQSMGMALVVRKCSAALLGTARGIALPNAAVRLLEEVEMDEWSNGLPTEGNEAGTYLLIGGPLDGERKLLSGKPPEIRIPYVCGFSIAGPGMEVRHATYRRMDIAGQAKGFTVYALAGFDGDAVVGALIEHYRPGKLRGV